MLAALDASHLQRIVFVSSSAVYGEHRGGWVDEDTPPAPQGFNGRILLEAEALLAARPESATALRLAGLYGPGPADRSAAARGPGRRARRAPHWANRITSMTPPRPSRIWPCCPPSRPCTSAATIRRCHYTSCTPTWRASSARPRHARARQCGQQETQQRAAARQRPASAVAGLAARLCGAAGRQRTRLSPRPARHALARTARPVFACKRMHGSFPIESCRDEPGYWRLVPSRARAMPPTDPIAAVTHADPYPYYAARWRASVRCTATTR